MIMVMVMQKSIIEEDLEGIREMERVWSAALVEEVPYTSCLCTNGCIVRCLGANVVRYQVYRQS